MTDDEYAKHAEATFQGLPESFEFGPIQTAFLEALESGEYAQTTHRLCSIDEAGTKCYCAMGVLLSVARKHGIKMRAVFRNGLLYINDRFNSTIPQSLRKELCIGQRGCINLMMLNDTNGLSLQDVASFVRHAPSKYFVRPV